MEAKLFFISLWCGVYGLGLRGIFRKEKWIENLWVAVGFNAFFWATAGVVFGMLQASYMAGAEFHLRYSLIYAQVGAAYGAVMAYLCGKKKPRTVFNGVFWGVVVVLLFRSSPKLALALLVFSFLTGAWTNKGGRERGFLLKDNLEWADTGFTAILLASVVMFFVVQAFKIPSGSMRMTFVEGDHLFVNKFIYGVHVPFSNKKILPFNEVERGEVVIFRFPSDEKDNPHYGKDFIKRVVAVAGQTVKIVNKKVFVDGVKQEESYIQHVDQRALVPTYVYPQKDYQLRWEMGDFADTNRIRDNFGPVTIPEGSVFVMGDNRDRSFDARFWGPLPLSAVKGKAWILYWPLKRFRVVHKKPKA